MTFVLPALVNPKDSILNEAIRIVSGVVSPKSDFWGISKMLIDVLRSDFSVRLNSNGIEPV